MSIYSLIAARQEIRKEWSDNFEKNYRSFADDLAQGIAKDAFEQLFRALKNPYAKIPDFNYSVALIDTSAVEAIKKLISEESAQLSPFNEWFENKNFSFFDSNYFHPLISKLGEELAKAVPEYLEAKRFKVTWHSNLNLLQIKVCFEEENSKKVENKIIKKTETDKPLYALCTIVALMVLFYAWTEITYASRK